MEGSLEEGSLEGSLEEGSLEGSIEGSLGEGLSEEGSLEEGSEGSLERVWGSSSSGGSLSMSPEQSASLMTIRGSSENTMYVMI